MAAMHWMARDLVWPPVSLGERGGNLSASGQIMELMMVMILY